MPNYPPPLADLPDAEFDRLKSSIVVYIATRQGRPVDANEITFETVQAGVSNRAGDIVAMLDLLVDLGELRIVPSESGVRQWIRSNDGPRL